MKAKFFLSCIALAILFSACNTTNRTPKQKIEQQIDSLMKDKKATVGVAVLANDETVAVYNNQIHFPLLSVFKFHVGLAVLDKMDKGHIALDSLIEVKSSQLTPNTYSPLREKYPNRDIPISYRNIIRYTMAHSDNNTCDFLIDFVGGISVVDSLIRQLGINKFAFSETEKTMHENILNCYNNWCTPSSMVLFLKKIYTEPILNNDHFLFLEQVMIETSTGTNKIKAGLPADVILGHKTGSSDRTKSGIKIGDNDAGIIYLPHNKRCYIAIFIKDS